MFYGREELRNHSCVLDTLSFGHIKQIFEWGFELGQPAEVGAVMISIGVHIASVVFEAAGLGMIT